jgi:hypothetical protein
MAGKVRKKKEKFENGKIPLFGAAREERIDEESLDAQTPLGKTWF